jgi:hypothetical protein
MRKADAKIAATKSAAPPRFSAAPPRFSAARGERGELMPEERARNSGVEACRDRITRDSVALVRVGR